MSAKSTSKMPGTKSSQNRRQPSILRRKRKLISRNSETSGSTSKSDSSSCKSPNPKHRCRVNEAKTPSSENTTCLPVKITNSGSSGLQSIPSSSSVGLASSEFSESDEHPSSLFEEPGMPSPAAPRPFRSLTCYSSPTFSMTRHSPLPQLSWADHKELWDIMLHKDAIYPRNCNHLSHHPQLQPRMRAILLEWLMEVSEVYKLHRETYYLAQDFIDRYLASQRGLPKQQLQLLGITCLFVAAKIEEIYPPKVSEFSYVTDNACSETEIIEKELVVLKVLNWDLTPLTVNAWLTIYIQLASSDGRQCFVYPDYPGIVLVKVAQLVDLCMLDVQALRFPYGIIAAAALYHTTSSRDIALSSTGLDWSGLAECVEWMKPFAHTIREDAKVVNIETFSNVLPEDQHNIQTHSVDLKLLDKALNRQEQSSRKSPDTPLPILTPPKSAKKVKTGAVGQKLPQP